jgi:hypothetical protein
MAPERQRPPKQARQRMHPSVFALPADSQQQQEQKR